MNEIVSVIAVRVLSYGVALLSTEEEVAERGRWSRSLFRTYGGVNSTRGGETRDIPSAGDPEWSDCPEKSTSRSSSPSEEDETPLTAMSTAIEAT
jgi:hypothetical protein